tara:strand:+ start:119 stop:334 length:216 start_codon:yes stop_codon:yes gene_type:complete
MKTFNRDKDNWRIVIAGKFRATYMNGGFWHLENRYSGDLIGAWLTKEQVRFLITTRNKHDELLKIKNLWGG